MQTDEFTRRVQERARLAAGDEALKIIAATLETLAERLPRNERTDLAAQLPEQLRGYLQRRPDTDRFSLEEFYNRVAARSGLGPPQAIEQAHVVLQVLQEAVSAGQLDRIRQQLPGQFGELFSGEPYGPASPSAPTA